MSATARDTIAAIATPPGAGALCVVRVSGPRAREVLRRLCPGLRADPPARRLGLQRIIDPTDGEEIDRALVVLFAAPRSFTGEDVVEVQGHGGGMVGRRLL
ncbi:MAG: tRNA uridine-5-carboxymethylaminomethyl(34) synthesis GTPase MnmE, partial [Deltaproteobacteria bacterium]